MEDVLNALNRLNTKINEKKFSECKNEVVIFYINEMIERSERIMHSLTKINEQNTVTRNKLLNLYKSYLDQSVIMLNNFII